MPQAGDSLLAKCLTERRFLLLEPRPQELVGELSCLVRLDRLVSVPKFDKLLNAKLKDGSSIDKAVDVWLASPAFSSVCMPRARSRGFATADALLPVLDESLRALRLLLNPLVSRVPASMSSDSPTVVDLTAAFANRIHLSRFFLPGLSRS